MIKVLAGKIDVPDCVLPYHIEPMIITACLLGGIALLIAVVVIVLALTDK